MASVRKRTWGDSTARKVGGKVAGSCWEVSWTDDGKRRKKSGFKTKAEAEAFAVERQKEVNDGLSRPAGHRKTLDQLIEEFLIHNEDRVRRDVISRGHLINQMGHFRNYICRKADWESSVFGKRVKPFGGAIGHLMIGRIRPSTILKLRDDLFLAGLRAGGVRQIIISLHSAFEHARGLDYIPTNPADRIPIERSRDEQVKRVTPPSLKTIHSVIANADGMLKLAIEVSACTGVQSLIFDLDSEEFGRPRLISATGSTPVLQASSGKVLCAWIGGAPVPAELLKHTPTDYGAAEIGAVMFRQRLMESAIKRSSLDYEFHGPWTAIWLSWLNDAGECARSFGPFEIGHLESHGLWLRLHGGGGTLVSRLLTRNLAAHTANEHFAARRLMF